ncbi:MAG: ABC transporter permease [Anaerovorax sp.]|nr:ABC transporter permease [Anaerovorax sp.]
MFLILFIISAIISPDFLSGRNISNLFRQNSGVCIVSMGMLMVILTGGIDLSVGSLMAVCSVFSAYVFTVLGLPIVLAFTLSCLLGIGMGACSGALISYAKMAPFIATLAMTTVAKGFALMISGGAPITVRGDNLNLSVISSGNFLGVPSLAWIMIAAAILTFWILHYTSYGRILRAIGSNESAVRLSGINTKNYKFSVYLISGFCASIAGFISICRTEVGSPIVGDGLELDAIAAVVIGGASLSGGKGNTFATFIGVLILGLINNIMNLLGVPSYPQQVVRGLIIIFAVLLQMLDKKNKE